MRRHGGYGGQYALGCRCTICVEANTRRNLNLRAKREATRMLVDGQLVAVEAPDHGVESTYVNWGCRCQPCKTANAAASQRKRDRRRTTANHPAREDAT